MYRKANDLCDFIGETVTIFTNSGGMSGSGFTGVVIYANECFVRLITCIGPPPGCALGNACSKNFHQGYDSYGGYDGGGYDGGYGKSKGGFYGGSKCKGGYDGGYDKVYNGCGLGSVVDIPLANIVAVVSNAV